MKLAPVSRKGGPFYRAGLEILSLNLPRIYRALMAYASKALIRCDEPDVWLAALPGLPHGNPRTKA